METEATASSAATNPRTVGSSASSDSRPSTAASPKPESLADLSDGERSIHRAVDVAGLTESRRADQTLLLGRSIEEILQRNHGRADELLAVNQRRHDTAEALRQRERVDAAMKACRVPGRYRAVDLNDLSSVPAGPTRTHYATAVAKARRIVAARGLLALLGAYGTGKTSIGCGLVNEACRAGRSGVYLHVLDYFQELKETYDRNGRRNEAAVERDYARVSLLVLDACEERGDTVWEDRMLVRLITKRCAEGLPTVLISNDKADTFEKRVGAAVVSRFAEGGNKVTCEWADLRGRAKFPTEAA